MNKQSWGDVQTLLARILHRISSRLSRHSPIGATAEERAVLEISCNPCSQQKSYAECGLKVSFDPSMQLEFRGAKITSIAGIFAYRELVSCYINNCLYFAAVSDAAVA